MKHQLNVRIPVELFRQLKSRVGAEGKSLTEVVEKLVREYLEEEDDDSDQ